MLVFVFGILLLILFCFLASEGILKFLATMFLILSLYGMMLCLADNEKAQPTTEQQKTTNS